MISTDFAPNESWSDAWISLKLLMQPWNWKSGKEIYSIKNDIVRIVFSNKYHPDIDRSKMVHLFLTGRSALYNLLKLLKLAKGTEVFIQAFTCEAVVLPILALGLKPLYIDIETDTFSMNYHKLTNQLTNNSRVLILQHTFGLTPKYRAEILNFAQNHNLIVIEDLAHGFNRDIFKTTNYSLLTTNYLLLSFGRSKAFSSVFGGAIISPNNFQLTINNLSYPSYSFIFRCLLYKPLAVLIKSTYDFYLGKILHRILNELKFLIPEITSKEKKGRFDDLLNKAYPNALAILLLNQLKKFDQIQTQRAKICEVYNQQFNKVPRSTFHVPRAPLIRYSLLVNNREEIMNKFKKQNIFLGKWYDQVVSPKDLDLDRVEYKKGSCPKAEEVCKKIINFPTNISEEQAKRVVNIFNDVI